MLLIREIEVWSGLLRSRLYGCSAGRLHTYQKRGVRRDARRTSAHFQRTSSSVSCTPTQTESLEQ
eukprot:3441859-Prymnesium_polylepis.2